jgi:hypothetical protein
MSNLRVLVGGAGAFLNRGGEILAGYVAGTLSSALTVVFFLLVFKWEFHLGFVAMMLAVAVVVAFYAISLPLMIFVGLAEIIGTSAIFFYIFTWGLIGIISDFRGFLPFSHIAPYGTLISFVSGFPGGIAYWFFAGRFTHRKVV